MSCYDGARRRCGGDIHLIGTPAITWRSLRTAATDSARVGDTNRLRIRPPPPLLPLPPELCGGRGARRGTRGGVRSGGHPTVTVSRATAPRHRQREVLKTVLKTDGAPRPLHRCCSITTRETDVQRCFGADALRGCRASDVSAVPGRHRPSPHCFATARAAAAALAAYVCLALPAQYRCCSTVFRLPRSHVSAPAKEEAAVSAETEEDADTAVVRHMCSGRPPSLELLAYVLARRVWATVRPLSAALANALRPGHPVCALDAAASVPSAASAPAPAPAASSAAATAAAAAAAAAAALCPLAQVCRRLRGAVGPVERGLLQALEVLAQQREEQAAHARALRRVSVKEGKEQPPPLSPAKTLIARLLRGASGRVTIVQRAMYFLTALRAWDQPTRRPARRPARRPTGQAVAAAGSEVGLWLSALEAALAGGTVERLFELTKHCPYTPSALSSSALHASPFA